jgi:hypothetical protein
MDKLKNVLFLLLLTPLHGYAQQALVATIEISDVQSAYVDRPGDLYVLQKKNIIKKFDIDGKLVDEFKFQDKLSTFDPRDGARLFACFDEKCSFFSAETKQEFIVEKEFAIEPVLICSSGDHNVWVLDKADLSLKKISPSESKVLTEVFLATDLYTKKPEIVFMREYQNFLFILDKNVGIVVYNGIGKRIRIISEPNLTYFNFLGKEIYFKKDTRLVFYDLFDTTTREEEIDPTCKYALITDVRKYLIYENKIDIFEIR